MDEAHKKTDQLLDQMEKKLSDIYGRAQKEVEKKTADFWKAFERKDEKQKAKLEAGDITEAQYKQWRQGQLMTGKHWEEMTKTVSSEMLNADKTAAAYINGKLPEIYSLNYNAIGSDSALKGYFFELVDAATVRNLATSDKTLLPYKYVDGEKVERWNTQKVNSEVMQGIIQGESIPKIAKRLGNVVGMEKTSAIRNARTTTTGAENKGRMDSYHDAQKQGIILKKRWIATHDPRTREEHLALDGQTVDVDEPFVNDFGEIMFPGDPDANPANVYNCRCSIMSHIEGLVDQTTGEYRDISMAQNEADYSEGRGESEKEIAKRAEDYESFDGLKDYMESKYNIEINDSIGDLDFNGVRSAVGGIEYMIDTFPELEGQIKRLSIRNEGFMCSDGKTIYFNSRSFSKKYYDGDDLYAFQAGAHEAGHCVDRILCDREALEKYGSSTLGFSMFMHNEISRKIVRRGIKEFMSENPEFAKYKAKDIRGLLSDYATADTAETVAEAVGRYAQIKSGKLVYPEKYRNNKDLIGRERFADKIIELLKGELGR